MLDDLVKDNWEELVEALRAAFDDDTEREVFLADVASFRRESKGLVEYKNELIRRIKLYQPDLAGVPTEFQRQAMARFIEGLDNADLKRKLRRHCKRDKLNIEEAFNYAVDSEASDIQTKIKEGETAAFSHKTFASAIIPSSGTKPKVHNIPMGDEGTSVNLREMQADIQGLAAKHKITEMQISELTAQSALTNDRITIIGKEVGQVAVNMAKLETSLNGKLSSLETMIRAGQSSAPHPNPTPHYGGQYGGQYGANRYQNSSNFRGRGGLSYNRPSNPQFQGQRLPSLTGGAGYINNQVQPTQFRMQGPGVNIPVCPATSVVPTSTTSVSSMAAFGAMGNPSALPAIEPNYATAAEAAIPAAHALQQQQFDEHAASSYWSPGMGQMSTTAAPGFDEAYGTYAYGGMDFHTQ